MNTTLQAVLDKLAERKRDALVGASRGPAYLVDPDLGAAGALPLSVDSLNSYVLTDTQISSEVQTSPVVDAIASLQLYINNIVFSVEPGYASIEWEIDIEPEEIQSEDEQENGEGTDPDPDTARNREYMRQKMAWVSTDSEYESWRTSVLMKRYPENYLSPSLRRNKTPAFENLIAALNQQELDETKTASAVESYLNEFESVANLNIISAYLGSDGNTYTGQMYLLGRSPTTPYIYYYRTCDLCAVDAEGYPVADAWTGWRRVDQLANNGNIIGRPRIALQNERVYVVWFERLIEAPGPIAVGYDDTKNTNDQVTITCYASYLKFDGSWSPAMVVVNYAMPLETADPTVLYPLYATGSQSDNYFNTVAFEYKVINTNNPILYCAIYTQDVSKISKNSSLVDNVVLAGGIDSLMNGSLEVKPINFVDSMEFYAYNSANLDGQELVQVMLEGPPLGVNLAAEIWDDSEVTNPEPTIFVGQSLPKVVAQTETNAGVANNVLRLSPKTSASGGLDMYSLTYCPGLTSPSFHGTESYTFNLAGVISGSYSIDPETWTGVLSYEIDPKAPFKPLDISGDYNSSRLPFIWFLPAKFTSGRTPNLATKEVVSVEEDGRKVTVRMAAGHGIAGDRGTLPPTAEELKQIQYGEILIDFLSDQADLTKPWPDDVNIITPAWTAAQQDPSLRNPKLTYYSNLLQTTKIETEVTYEIVAKDDATGAISHSHAYDTLDNLSNLVIENQTYKGHGENLCVGIVTYKKGDTDKKEVVGQTWRRVFFRELSPVDLTNIHAPILKSFQKDTAVGTPVAWYLDISDTHFPAVPASTPKPNIRLNSTFVSTLIARAGLGLQYLYTWNTQQTQEPPLDDVADASPMDFSGANGIYFWELFLHVPMLVAETYCAQGEYEIALQWYNRVFDPRARNQKEQGVAAIPPYWNVVPIAPGFDENGDPDQPTYYSPIQDIPNDPYAAAYEDPYHFRQSVYMSYVQALIDVGDSEYRRLTFESVNKAMRFYTWAYDILGNRPAESLSRFVAGTTIDTAAADSNVTQLTADESVVWPKDWPLYPATAYLAAVDDTSTIFAPPENTRLMALWDTIDARRYNIRHDLTITGEPIGRLLFLDYANLAGGNRPAFKPGSIWDAATDAKFKVSPYRYEVMVSRARSAVATVISFGQQLLGYMGGYDGRRQAELQQQQLAHLRQMTISSANFGVESAKAGLDVLKKSRAATESRKKYYSGLYEGGQSALEVNAANTSYASATAMLASAGTSLAVGAMKMFPNIFGLAVGGSRLEGMLEGLTKGLEATAFGLETTAGDLATQASYQRRSDDWLFQSEQAEADLEVLEKQIYQQEIQIQAAKNSLALTIRQCDDIDIMLEFIQRGQYTGKDMYAWLTATMSSLYRSAYDLAWSQCLQAQACWNYELVAEEDFFSTLNAWNDVRRGMLAGEVLQGALDKMDAEWYSARNARKMEITKTISVKKLLGTNSTTAWDTLLNEGKISFSITDDDLNADYPDFYMRQLVAVSVTLPAAVGPLQNICATLQQTKSTIRDGSNNAIDRPVAIEQVALSHGVNDSGLFTLNFGDPRYLPFEGTGAESDWSLKFTDPTGSQKQMLQSLDDIIFTINYKARPRPSNTA